MADKKMIEAPRPDLRFVNVDLKLKHFSYDGIAKFTLKQTSEYTTRIFLGLPDLRL